MDSRGSRGSAELWSERAIDIMSLGSDEEGGMNVLVRGQGHGKRMEWEWCKHRTKASARGRAGCSSTTCKAVVVDGIDDFLYFGAVLLSKGGWGRG